jgi:hypothetical protein
MYILNLPLEEDYRLLSVNQRKTLLESVLGRCFSVSVVSNSVSYIENMDIDRVGGVEGGST